jgi:hypothetical protein
MHMTVDTSFIRPRGKEGKGQLRQKTHLPQRNPETVPVKAYRVASPQAYPHTCTQQLQPLADPQLSTKAAQ